MTINTLYFDTVDSTNLEARRMIASADPRLREPFLIVASEQTAGRGRQGKKFFSPKGTGIYMTIVLPADEVLSKRMRQAGDSVPDHSDAKGYASSLQVTLTCRVGVAVSKILDDMFECSTGIKWVNDIYLHRKKICGILCEAISDADGFPSHILVGIGINISTTDFPDDIRETAGSLETISGKISKEDIRSISEAVFRSVLEHLKPEYDPINDYKNRSIVLGNDVSFTEGGITRSACAVDIDEKGGLVVITDDTGEMITLSSGEITLRLAPARSTCKHN
ncbi:MAG: biotin--[acetyl-CoA-carboxylase] ligase [Lachnospiraceae bacterium]|nr:biotin--[acetyl-CoA-carboxylase] ligase [Lachnospiraceae bacterium]